MHQLSEEDIRKLELRKEHTSTPLSEMHPVIRSAVIAIAAIAAVVAVLWLVGVAQ